MTGKFSATLLCLLLAWSTDTLVCAARGDELAITSGGRRIVDRDPLSADSNCFGWSYGASPVTDDGGNVVAMYTVSDALSHHCDVGIESIQRFGDAIQRHDKRDNGVWSAGTNVIDRRSFAWMNDPAFLAAHPESFVGHVSSPSVVRADGRYYMAFVGSVDDRNLCAGEHAMNTPCGSCTDPWSYFVAMWAVSDDGVTWRLHERDPGNASLIGREPDAADRLPQSQFKGVTRVTMVAATDEGRDYFYIGAQYWSRGYIKNLMFRIARDPSNVWGIAGDPQVWSWNRHAWLDCVNGRVPDFFSERDEYSLLTLSYAISSISRTTIFGYDAYIALASSDSAISINEFHRANSVTYYISRDLVNWTGGAFLRSALRDFADGYGYDASVIDPIAVDRGDGTLTLFFASADGDRDNGVVRDGQYDCFLDPAVGVTAPYVGTGIYESTVRWVALQPTTISLEPQTTQVAAGSLLRFKVRVTSADMTVPEGTITIAASGGGWVEKRLRGGEAVLDLAMRGAGDVRVWANFSTRGVWQPSSAETKVNVVAAPRRRSVRH